MNYTELYREDLYRLGSFDPNIPQHESLLHVCQYFCILNVDCLPRIISIRPMEYVFLYMELLCFSISKPLYNNHNSRCISGEVVTIILAHIQLILKPGFLTRWATGKLHFLDSSPLHNFQWCSINIRLGV